MKTLTMPPHDVVFRRKLTLIIDAKMEDQYELGMKLKVFSERPGEGFWMRYMKITEIVKDPEAPQIITIIAIEELRS